MISNHRNLLTNICVAGLFLAFFLLIYSAIKSENYRIKTAEIINTEQWIRFTLSKTAQRINESKTYISNNPKQALQYLVPSSIDIKNILNISSLENFIPKESVLTLETIENILKEKIIPNLTETSDFQRRINFIPDLEDAASKISNITADRRSVLQVISQINSASYRNLLIFTSALGLLSISGFFLLQRRKISEERKK